MTSQISNFKEHLQKLQSELPVQEPLAGSRAKMSPENQVFLDARVLEIRQQMENRFEQALLDKVGAKVGVSQASSVLRKALDLVASVMKRHDCEEAAALGYSDVSSAYIFLQRTLGDLQSSGYARSELISEIAGQVGYTFEDVVKLLPEEDYVIPNT